METNYFDTPDTALSTIRLLPFSKQQVEVFSSQIKDSLMSGEVDPLELAVYFKSIEKTIEAVKETLSPLALAESEKSGKSFEYKGAKIEIKELGTKYDYSKCGDTEFERLESEINALNDRKKEREAMLKNLTGSLTVVNEDTGEMETIYPPVKRSTTGIAITIR